MKKTYLIVSATLVGVFIAAILVIPPVRETVYETFVPTSVNTEPVSTVSRVVYRDDPGTLIIYFSDRPRVDYHNFPKEEYEALKRAEDQSVYYFEKIHGQYKAY